MENNRCSRCFTLNANHSSNTIDFVCTKCGFSSKKVLGEYVDNSFNIPQYSSEQMLSESV